MKTAFLIGNGRSRLGFPLEKYRGLVTTAGCNALYRDFMPKYLLAVDDAMQATILHENVHHQTNFLKVGPVSMGGTRPVGLVKPEKPWELVCWVPGKNWKAGPSLGWSLPVVDPSIKRVLLIGLDMGSSDGKPNNVYTNTPLYRQDWKDEVPYDDDWIHWQNVFMMRLGITWVWMKPSHCLVPSLWSRVGNLKVCEGWTDLVEAVDKVLA
jgi:hypothetical protein